ncbi:MAG: serine/threonine-protein kinase [Rudaea sp.]
MTDASRWQRVRELFAKSLEQPDDSREVWLQSHCDDPHALAEIQRLLAQRNNPISIFRADAQALLGQLSNETAADTLIDTDIGPYRLRKLLGVGGMGRVYLAERSTGEFRQQVALKLIRSEFADHELRQRFLRERNTLARLAHPNIAQLHDGGVADGAPYFTLEYIEGAPITHWCDAHAADVRTRVSLMLKVCDAVLHAHRSLIVHRDLKPSNILVNKEGEPKLLDFGIAKPLDETIAAETLTNANARPMTREYAAPEQLLGDPVTTATDIYALGVLLYLLLSGHMPYRRAEIGETSWIKAILEDAPEPMERAIDRNDVESIAKSRAASPAALKKILRGDLERIVQRALAKNAESRYTTADKLGDDLRAYIAGRAISGGTRTYRMRKFVRRNWLPLSAGAVVLLLIVAGSIGMALQSRRIAAEAQTTAAVKDFLLNVFRGADPEQAKGHEISARELIDRGAERLTGGMQDQVLLRGELESVVGSIYNDLALPDKADALEQRAIQDLTDGHADSLLLAQSEHERSRALFDGGKYDDSLAMNLRAVEHLRAMRSPPPEQMARSLAQQSWIKIAFHQFDEAKLASDDALAYARRDGVSRETLADVSRIAAVVARGLHDLDRSEQLQREVIALHRALRGDSDPSVAVDLDELGNILDAAGRMSDSRDAKREALALAEAQLGDGDPRLAQIRQNYADVLRLYGRFAEAHVLLDKAGAYYRTAANDDMGWETRRAELAGAEGDYAAAESYWRAAIAEARRMLGPNSSLEITLMWSIAYLHALQGHVEEAAKEAEQLNADSAGRRTIGSAKIAVMRGDIARLRGDYAGAERILRQAAATPSYATRNNSYENVRLHESLALTLALEGKTAEAEQLIRDALATIDTTFKGETTTMSAQLAYEFARMRSSDADGGADAIDLAQRAARELAQFFGAESARARDAQALLARLKTKPAPAADRPVSAH